jgi:hypothetical protein
LANARRTKSEHLFKILLDELPSQSDILKMLNLKPEFLGRRVAGALLGIIVHFLFSIDAGAQIQ